MNRQGSVPLKPKPKPKQTIRVKGHYRSKEINTFFFISLLRPFGSNESVPFGNKCNLILNRDQAFSFWQTQIHCCASFLTYLCLFVAHTLR